MPDDAAFECESTDDDTRENVLVEEELAERDMQKLVDFQQFRSLTEDPNVTKQEFHNLFSLWLDAVVPDKEKLANSAIKTLMDSPPCKYLNSFAFMFLL